MSFAAIGSVVGAVGSAVVAAAPYVVPAVIAGSMASNASKEAAGAQAGAINQASDVQKQIFNQQMVLQEPFRQSGMSAQNKLMEYLGIGGNDKSADYGKYAKDFSTSDYTQDPGYSFRFNEGLKALNATAAARGGLMSGAALKAASRYGQDYLSNEYMNAFNRYQTNRSNQLNPLQSLANQGMSSANTIGQAGQNYAGNMSNLYQSGGNVAASGIVGSANAWNNALGNAYNNYQSQQMINNINQSSYSPSSINTYYTTDNYGGYQ